MMMTSDAGGGGSYSSQSMGADRLPLLPGASDSSRPPMTGTTLVSASASSPSSTISRSRDSRRRNGADRLADNGCHVFVLCAGEDCTVVADLRSVVVGIVVADIAARHAVSFALIRSSLRTRELGSADFGGSVLSPDDVAVSVVTAVCSVVADVVATESVIYKTKPTACNPSQP